MWADVVRSLALASAVLTLAPVAAAADPPDYSLKALGHLNCVQINDKINEGIAAGSAEAAYSSAQLLIRRICFRYDPKAYVVLLKKAADAGHKLAKGDLGYAIGLGEGAPQNYARAGELFSEVFPEPRSEGFRNAPPEKSNYTLGYARTLLRLATREVNDLPRRWWKHDHVVHVAIKLTTPGGEHSVTARREGAIPEGAESEAREAEKLVREAAEDSYSKAVNPLPVPDKTLLVEEDFIQPVVMTIFPSTSKRNPTAAEVDTYLPR